jgi:hypothetical protein
VWKRDDDGRGGTWAYDSRDMRPLLADIADEFQTLREIEMFFFSQTLAFLEALLEMYCCHYGRTMGEEWVRDFEGFGFKHVDIMDDPASVRGNEVRCMLEEDLRDDGCECEGLQS